MRDFIDLHCHILPDLDDGPTDLRSAVELVQGLARLGFREFHPTPHQAAGRWTPTEQQRNAAADALRAALEHAGTAVEIAAPAGENMWDELFLQRQQDHSYPTYAGNRAFLLEFSPGNPPPRLPQRLFDMRLEGFLPVIAHVERYPELTSDRGLLEQLAGKAALLVNISTLGGLGGWSTRRAARRLVLDGHIHALASDAHGAPDLKLCATGLEWLHQHVEEAHLRRLLVEAPRLILAGEHPTY